MIYLIVQVFILLLLVGVLGLVFGWYLSRISAANAHSSLQARLRTAEGDARELRAELDSMTTAKNNADIERRLLSDELADMRARQDAAERSTGSGGSIAGAAMPKSPVEDEDGTDDLQQIKGIGPKIAGILQELGIQRFEQIATWTPEKVDWVNERLRFKGRIEREEWIAQARALMAARDD